MSGLAGLLLLITLSPGPNNLVLLNVGTSGGMSRAFAAVLGIQVGSLLVLALVWLGVVGGALIAGLDRLMVYGGALLLIIMAFSIFMGGKNGSVKMPAMAFWPLMLFQLANPKSWMLVFAALSVIPKQNDALLEGAVFLTIFVLAPLCAQLIWLAAGAVIREKFDQSQRFDLLFRYLMAGALLLFAGMGMVNGM